jgi:hypothetical protein
MFKRVAPWCVAVMAMAVPAAAQDKPYGIAIGAALVGPLSDSADRFSTGLGFTAGATWHITPQIGLTGDYLWSTLGTQDDWGGLVATRPVGVTPRIQFGTVSLRFQAPPAKVRIHLVGGLGLYHRTLRMATSGSGDISVCDPWWLVCTAGSVPGGGVDRTHATTDPGINIGAGITAGMFFAEIRYHFMWGPSFTTPSGPQKATGKFLPLTIGVVF